MLPHSYRRGKPESNDIDIVVTYPKADGKRTQELCQELTDVLSKKGLVTHLMSESETTRHQCVVTNLRDEGIQHLRVKIHQTRRTRTFLRRRLPSSPFPVPTGVVG